MTAPRIGAPKNPMASIAWTTGGGKPGGSAVVPPSTTTTRRAVIIAKATAHSPQASLAAVRALTRPPWCPARMNRPLRDCSNGHHCPRYAARLLPATQRRIAARALQSPPVAHLGDHHAQDLVGAFGAIRDPARDLVEAARAVVAWQHPQHGLLIAEPGELRVGRHQQRPAGSRPPVVGVDVDRGQLAGALG